jgi:hypothetical protein
VCDLFLVYNPNPLLAVFPKLQTPKISQSLRLNLLHKSKNIPIIQGIVSVPFKLGNPQQLVERKNEWRDSLEASNVLVSQLI